MNGSVYLTGYVDEKEGSQEELPRVQTLLPSEEALCQLYGHEEAGVGRSSLFAVLDSTTGACKGARLAGADGEGDDDDTRALVATPDLAIAGGYFAPPTPLHPLGSGVTQLGPDPAADQLGFVAAIDAVGTTIGFSGWAFGGAKAVSVESLAITSTPSGDRVLVAGSLKQGFLQLACGDDTPGTDFYVGQLPLPSTPIDTMR